MTISSQVRKAGPFLGTGAVVDYPFNFKVFSAANLLLVTADAVGVESTLVLNSDYTVTLNGDQDSSPGGTVALTNPLTLNHTLVITSDIDALQPTDLTNQGGFYPAVVNAALDRLTILVQQLAEQVDRAIKSPITSTVDPDNLIAALQQAASDAETAAAAAATFDPALYLSKAGNLTGIANASTARANLELGSAATRTALGINGSLYSRDSILDQVGQTAGVPTGGIIECGSNANGEFVRFADGTLICSRFVASATTSSATGSIFHTPPASGSWAATFVATPVVAAAALSATEAHCWAGSCVVSTTGFSSLVAFSTINTASCGMSLIAVGRWF